MNLRLDEKTRVFSNGFEVLAQRLWERYYTSVSDFSRDLSRVFTQVLAPSSDDADGLSEPGIEAIHSQLNEVQPGTAEHLALSQEQKDLKRLTKRIVKAVKEPLEQAMRREAELRGREHEEEIKKLESMGIFASAVSKSLEAEGDEDLVSPDKPKTRSSNASAHADVVMSDTEDRADEAIIHLNILGTEDTVPIPNKKSASASKSASNSSSSLDYPARISGGKPTEPISPPTSRSSSAPNGTVASAAAASTHDFFAHGGVPWYLEPFDPSGTTIHEERYTGRAVLRDMSEELSDMDEDTLTELAGNGVDLTPSGKGTASNQGLGSASRTAAATAAATKQNKKKKGRRQQWSKAR